MCFIHPQKLIDNFKTALKYLASDVHLSFQIRCPIVNVQSEIFSICE